MQQEEQMRKMQVLLTAETERFFNVWIGHIQPLSCMCDCVYSRWMERYSSR